MNRLLPFAIVAAVLLLIGSSCIYVISEVERGVKLRFGAMQDADIPPGLHFKWPIIDVVRRFDARVLTLDSAPESFFTVQKKRLIVDAYAKWRIEDVETYYKSTGGDELRAHNRLSNRMNDGLRNQFGTRTLHEVVSGERDMLMKELMDHLNETVRENLGVVIVDVRVKRIDLPEEVSDQVFRRMTAERQKEAQELRSEGKEEAEKIRAAADREKTVLVAQAYKEAESLRGEGDAKATAVYASAYTKDAEFYSFVRSLTAYKNSFKDKGDVLLVEPDSEFFRYLNGTGQ